jgi:hypothetical protein
LSCSYVDGVGVLLAVFVGVTVGVGVGNGHEPIET